MKGTKMGIYGVDSRYTTGSPRRKKEKKRSRKNKETNSNKNKKNRRQIKKN